jgi:hypothetical protein
MIDPRYYWRLARHIDADMQANPQAYADTRPKGHYYAMAAAHHRRALAIKRGFIPTPTREFVYRDEFRRVGHYVRDDEGLAYHIGGDSPLVGLAGRVCYQIPSLVDVEPAGVTGDGRPCRRS